MSDKIKAEMVRYLNLYPYQEYSFYEIIEKARTSLWYDDFRITFFESIMCELDKIKE